MPSAAEYLVKLGVNLDTANMAKLENFLKSSKVQAAAMSGALVALGTIIYKFVKSTTEFEYSLRQLAKEQNKTVEATRAQENALKAMGTTAQEIERNGTLKSIYKDIVEINKSMSLPNMDKVLGNVTKLRGEFYALKSTIRYAMQWINFYILQDLAKPIQQLTEFMKKARTWLQENMKDVTRSIAKLASTFMRGLFGIAQGAHKVVDLFGKLPAGIKSATVAIAAMWAAMNSGPIGKIIMAVEALGDLMHDYENYQFNKGKGLEDSSFYNRSGMFENGYLTEAGRQELIASGIEDPTGIVRVGLSNFWDILSDPTRDLGSKATGIFDEMFGGISEEVQKLASGETSIPEIIKNALLDKDGNVNLGGALAGGLLVGLTADALQPVFNTIKSMFSVTDGLGFALTGIGSLGYEFAEALRLGINPGDQESPFWQAIDDIGEMFGASDLSTKFAQALNLFDENGKLKVDPTIVDFAAMGAKIAGQLFSDKAALAEAFGDGVALFNIVSAALGDGELDPKEKENIATQLGDTLSSLFMATNSPLLKIIGVIGEAMSDPKVGGAIMTELFGELENEADNYLTGARKGGGVWDNFMDILLGVKDSDGNRTGGLWDSIKGFFKQIIESDEVQQVATSIRDAIVNAFNGLWDLVSGTMDTFWVNLYNSMPDWMKSLLTAAGIENPNSSAVEDNGDGTFSIKDTNNNELVFGEKVDPITGLKLSDVLSEFSSEYSINPDTGNITFKAGSEFASAVGSDLGDRFGHRNVNTFDYWQQAVDSAWGSGDVEGVRYLMGLMKQARLDYNAAPKGSFGNRSEEENAVINGLRSSLDAYYAENPAKKPTGDVTSQPRWALEGALERQNDQASAAAASIRTNAGATLEEIKDVDDALDDIDGKVVSPVIELQGDIKGDPLGLFGPKQAYGGRFDKPTYGEFGEDGTEYIIPITKPARAYDLIMQMFSEMGGAAVSKILAGLGVNGDGGTIGGSLAAASGLISGAGSTINYNNNVSAPVTINVQPGMANSMDVGSRVYSLTERYLLRTVQGVLA